MVPGAFDLAVFGFPALGADMIARGYAALADPSLGRCYRDQVARYARHMAGLGLDHFTGTLTLVRRPAAAHPGTTLVTVRDADVVDLFRAAYTTVAANRPTK